MASNPWEAAANAFLTALTGWIRLEQDAIVAYQKEENRDVALSMWNATRIHAPGRSTRASFPGGGRILHGR
jgi:hypothetical protein